MAAVCFPWIIWLRLEVDMEMIFIEDDCYISDFHKFGQVVVVTSGNVVIVSRERGLPVPASPPS